MYVQGLLSSALTLLLPSTIILHEVNAIPPSIQENPPNTLTLPAKSLLFRQNPILKQNTGSLINPFLYPPLGQQVTPSMAGVTTCPGRPYIDWLRFYNLSMISTLLSQSTLPSYSLCFNHCITFPATVGFTFDSLAGTCKCFNNITRSSIKSNSFPSTLSIRDKIGVLVLRQWLVKSNERPAQSPMLWNVTLTKTAIKAGAMPVTTTTIRSVPAIQKVNTWIDCMALAERPDLNGVPAAAVFDQLSQNCTLYNGTAADVSSATNIEPNLVTLVFADIIYSDPTFRFKSLGQVYPVNVSPLYSISVQTGGACLATCVQDPANCTIVVLTPSKDEPAIDCLVYKEVGTTFANASISSPFISSYWLKAPEGTAGKYVKLAHYSFLRGQILSTIPNVDTEDSCHTLARQNPNSWHYAYNTSRAGAANGSVIRGSCTLYGQSVSIDNIGGYNDTSVLSFSKAIPTNFTTYYEFEPYWMTSLPFVAPPGNSSQCTAPSCVRNCAWRDWLRLCSSRPSCYVAAFNWKLSYCLWFNATELSVILNGTKEDNPNITTNQPFQVFQKTGGDLNFTDPANNTRFLCLGSPSLDWNDLNNFYLSQGDGQDLEAYRNSLPVDTNGPAEPHGSNFSGQQNATTPPLPKGLKSSQSTLDRIRKKTGSNSSSCGQVQSQSRLSYYGPDLFPGSPVVITPGIGDTFNNPGPGNVGGGIIFSHSGMIDHLTCLQANCTSQDGPMCIESCPLAKTDKEVIRDKGQGQGVGQLKRLIQNEKEEIQKKTKEEEGCERRSFSGYGNSSYLTRSGGSKCTCDDQPGTTTIMTRSVGTISPLDLPALQNDCRRSQLNQRCQMCCKVGYFALDSVCVCRLGDAEAHWEKNPAECMPLNRCITGNGLWGSAPIWYFPVLDCRGRMYYGAAFLPTFQIPLWTIYKFTALNEQTSQAVFGRPAWRAYACTDNQLSDYQLTNDFYTNMNAHGTYDKGHLAPNADFQYNLDATVATHMFVNAVPQDRQSNIAWGNLEGRIRQFFRGRGGYIITGCLPDPSPIMNSPIPDIIWKMACTRLNNGVVSVGAFFHRNIQTESPQDLEDRKVEMFQVRNPDNLGTLIGFNPRREWLQALQFFTNPADQAELNNCAFANVFSIPTVSGSMKQSDNFTIYYEWQNSLFGTGFNPDLDVPSEPSAVSDSGSPPSCGKRVVGYVSSWGTTPLTDALVSYYTVINFAFMEMRADSSVAVGSADAADSTDPNLDQQLSYLRLAELQQLKPKWGFATMFAVGGWANSQYFSATAADPGRTQTFINSCIQLLDQYQMDGIDIDWEYPVGGGANPGIPADRQNFVLFLQQIRSAMTAHQAATGRSQPYFLSIAGAAGSWVLDPGYDLSDLLPSLDWINVMAYDYFGAWTSQWGAYTGPIAPLYFGSPPGYSGKVNADFTLKYYSCRMDGLRDKLNLGLGFYGRYWNNSGTIVGPSDPLWRKAPPNAEGTYDGGFEPWSKIQGWYLQDSSFTTFWHDPTKTPYLTGPGGLLLAYENPQSITEKVRYAGAKGFGGVMVWSIDLDDPVNTLTRTASSNLLCSGSQPDIPFDYKCSPIQDQGPRWWTLQDGNGSNAGMCGKSAPLYNGFYAVCDPDDPDKFLLMS